MRRFSLQFIGFIKSCCYLLCLGFCLYGAPSEVAAQSRFKTQQRKNAGRKTAKPAPRKATPQPHITPAMLRGKIAFMQDLDLWVINPDGSGKRKILSKPVGGYFSSNSVAFSPDYSHIAFVYDRPNDDPYLSNELFIMRLDDTRKRQLTNRKYVDGLASPRFSPDGRRILYTRFTGKHGGGPGEADADIWVVNVDGSGHRRVIGDYRKFDATHSGAAWSRDGRRVFFWRTKGTIPENPDYPRPTFEPWSVAIDGSDAQPLNDAWSEFVMPGISCDGRWRITESEWDEAKRIYTPLTLHNLQSHAVQFLTRERDTKYFNPHWGPDSELFAVEWSHSISKNNLGRTLRGIHIIRRDGAPEKRLLDNALLITWLP